MTTIRLDAVINRVDVDRLMTAVEPRVVLKLIGQQFIHFIGKSFETRGRGGWRPLAVSTLALRVRGGDVPLQDTGKYRQSFVTATDDSTYVEAGTSLKTATGVPLGKVHESGTGPYTIQVKQARMLAAKTRAGTWMIFGRKIEHPGIPARPVLPTLSQAEALLKPALEEMLIMARDGK